MDRLSNVFQFSKRNRMNFHQTLASILNLTVPYKNLKYYKQYFKDAKLIVVNKNNSEINKIKLLCVIIFYETVHLLFISFKNQSQSDKLASFNVSHFFTNSNLLNYIYSLVFIEGIIFFHIQYFKIDMKLVVTLENILFYNLPKNLFVSEKYKKRSVQEIVKLFAYFFVNSLIIFVLICDFFVIYNVICYINVIIKLKISDVFTILQFIFHAIAFLIVYTNVSHVLIISASFFLTLLFSHYLALKQLYEQIYCINTQNFLKFQTIHSNILTSILRVNKLMSTLFLVFLVINCPSNAYVGSWLVTDKKASVYGKTFVAVFCSHQNVCIMFYHGIFSYFCQLIHYPSKPLLSLMPKEFKIAKINTKIRLHNFLNAIHVHKRYGFTYSTIGLITLNSFVKVILVYL